MLALCGHPFSAYTRKAPIGLHALALYCDFRVLDAEHPEHGMIGATQAGPQGQFPVLVDGARVAFEATCVVEYLDLIHLRLKILLNDSGGEPVNEGDALFYRILGGFSPSSHLFVLHDLPYDGIPVGCSSDRCKHILLPGGGNADCDGGRSYLDDLPD